MQSGGDQKSTRADIVIVGGGPATLGLLTNAMKQNRLHELVSTGDGLAVIEQGMTLGGGELQNFGVNSNTSARGFLKCAYKRREVATNNHADHGDNNNSNKKTQGEKASPAPKKKKQTDGDQEEESEDELAEDSERCDGSDDEQGSPQKQWQTLPLNCFKDLYQLSPIYKTMAEYGSRIVPLAVVGMYLNYCGNHLLHYIYQVMRRRVFYPCHRVTSIQLLQNGDVLTHAVKRVFTMKVNAADGTVTFGTESTQNVTFRSKAVIVSNGGRQQLPPTFSKQWFPFLKDKMDRVLLSDNFMKRDIYKKTMAMIKEQKLKRIVIIGASHSGFSCAWLLLFGPATWRRNNALVRSGQAITRARFPDAPLKSNPNCGECCSCSEAKKQKNPKCDCLCKCWGYFKYEDWDFDHDKDLPTHYGPSSIKILYRDKVRVFYGTVNQAKADGYTEFSEHVFSNPRGFVYSYTGLRSDSKWLYRQVKHGHEKRVALVAAPKPEDQAEHLRDADLVIWACGYHTNKIPIKDQEGKEITLSQRVANTQFDVDGKCRVCVSDGSLLTKTFGTGLAYPTRTNDGMIRRVGGKPDPRADSFSLYCGWIGNRILQNILPKTQLEGKLHRTMRNNRKQAIENNANNNNNQMASPNKKANGKADGAGKNQGQQAPSAARKLSTSKTRKADSASKKQGRARQQMGGGGTAAGDGGGEEGSADAANGERASTPVRNAEKPKSASPFGAKDTTGEGKEAVSKQPEAKEGNKKTASYGGYLRGTLASETRAKLVKASAQEQEAYAYATPEKAAPASSGGGIYIPPQITQSQQQYIQRRKEAIEREQAELQQLMDKHKPPPPQQRNHAGVQSRYLKQAATVAANAAKKADAANKANNSQVKKSNATQASKTKNKEKAKPANPQGNEPVLEREEQPQVAGDGSHGEERKDDKAGFASATEKAINNYISQQTAIPTAHHYHPSHSTQPSPSQLHSSSPPPPTDSANNTWSASTAEGERGKQVAPEGQDRRGKEDVTFTRHERDISSPDGLNDAEESILLSRAPVHGHLLLRDHRQMSRRTRRASKGKGNGDQGSSSSLQHREGEMNGASDMPEPSWAAGQEEEGSGARQVAKLSQNYMVQHSQEKPMRAIPQDFSSPQKGQLFQNLNRQGHTQVRTQERKKSGHPLIHGNIDGSPGRCDAYQLQGTVTRPYSKNEQDNARLEGQQNQKPVVHSMTEEKPKVGSPNALANFQTAEPIVSRAKRMQDCLERFEALPGISASLNQTSSVQPPQSNQAPAHFKNQSVKAHSPDFYSSKVKFTAPFPATTGQHLVSSVLPSSASNGHPQPPATDPIHKHHTQKLSSLFGRNEHHSGGSAGAAMNGSQSSKGLSFNQYMIKQQEQALQLQNPLLLKQQQQVLIAKQHGNSAAHRPSKSQWLAQMDSQQQQMGQGHVMLQQNGAKIAGSTNGVKQTIMIAQYQNAPNQYYLPQFYQSTDNQAVKPNAFGMKANQIIIPPKNGQNVPFQGLVAAHGNQIAKTGMSADQGQRNYNQMQKQMHYLQQNVNSQSTAEYGPLNGGSNPQSLIKPPNSTSQHPQSLTKKTIFLQQQQAPPILSNAPNGSQGQNPQQSPQMPLKVFQIPGLAGQTAINMMNGSSQISGGGHGMPNGLVKGERVAATGVHKGPQLLPLNPPFKKVKGSMVTFSQPVQPALVSSNPLQMAGAQNLAAIVNPSDISFQQQTGKEASSGSGTQTTNFNTSAHKGHPLKKATELTGSAGNLLTSTSKRNSMNGGQVLGDMTEADKRHNNTMKPSSIKFTHSLSEMQNHLSVKIQQHSTATHQIKLDSGEVKVATIAMGGSPMKKPLPQFVGGDQRVVGISTAMTDKQTQQLQGDTSQSRQHVFKTRQNTIAAKKESANVEGFSSSLQNTSSGSKLHSAQAKLMGQQQQSQHINTIMMNVNLNSPKQIIISNVMPQQAQQQPMHPNQQTLHQHQPSIMQMYLSPPAQAHTTRPT